MSAFEIAAVILMTVGTLFFIAGTIGLLRLPDVYTRLHALTKADNLGLGLVILGLSLLAESWIVVAKLVLIWALVMISSATACYLVAEAARLGRVRPWRNR